MALIFWDASALIKRYIVEIGSDVVDAIFTSTIQARTFASSSWGYTEAFSILVRRHNAGAFDRRTFAGAVTLLQTEVFSNTDFGFLSINDALVFASIALIQKHNLNATDAAILSILLEYQQSVGAQPCLLVASDKRLLRAAETEGLKTLNPEAVAAADVPALLASFA